MGTKRKAFSKITSVTANKVHDQWVLRTMFARGSGHERKERRTSTDHPWLASGNPASWETKAEAEACIGDYTRFLLAPTNKSVPRTASPAASVASGGSQTLTLTLFITVFTVICTGRSVTVTT